MSIETIEKEKINDFALLFFILRNIIQWRNLFPKNLFNVNRVKYVIKKSNQMSISCQRSKSKLTKNFLFLNRFSFFFQCSFERNDVIINYIITSPTFNEDCKKKMDPFLLLFKVDFFLSSINARFIWMWTTSYFKWKRKISSFTVNFTRKSNRLKKFFLSFRKTVQT